MQVDSVHAGHALENRSHFGRPADAGPLAGRAAGVSPSTRDERFSMQVDSIHAGPELENRSHFGRPADAGPLA